MKITGYILFILVLICGISGITSAAATQSFNPGFISDPSFLSPDWKVTPITTSFSDPTFLSKNWSVPAITPFADQSFLYKNWSVPAITPFADQNFLYKNWSVPNFKNGAPFYQVYIYNPGSSTPYTVPDASQLKNFPPYDPFAPLNPGWKDSGYLFGP
jgi:hypothetical protein